MYKKPDLSVLSKTKFLFGRDDPWKNSVGLVCMFNDVLYINSYVTFK
jgi:hypothetical protein